MGSIIDILRGPKIDDFVIFDWVATLAGAEMISKITGFSFIIVLLILLIISVFLHMAFDIDTKTNYLLGLSKYPER